jgi:Rieske Fe-S protein
MNDLFSRRDVIKTFMVTAATSLIGNKVWAAKAVSEIAPAIDPDMGFARVVLSSFPALNNNNGSVRLGSSSISNNFPIGLYYPILINRISATEYVALDTSCTHAGCVVPTFSSSQGFIECACHGSRYNIRGQVLRAPATAPLTSFPTRLNNGVLEIDVFGPGLGFEIRSLVAEGAAGKRIALTFTTFAGVEYEVRHRATIGGATTVVPCALSITGPISQSSITGNETDRTIYVAPADGFFQIAVRLRAV